MDSIVEIYKNGRHIGTSRTHGKILMGSEGFWPAIKELECYFFSRLALNPPVLFEHMAGMALNYFLDNCVLRVDGNSYEPFRYVHGRSESMRGRVTVSSVLLAKVICEEPVEETTWYSYTPSIYKRFTQNYTGL